MRQPARFLLTFTFTVPLSVIWYGPALQLDLALVSTVGRRPSEGMDWLPFVCLHLATWSLPFLIGAIVLREKLGPAVFFGVMAALVLTAWLDGGHLVRRAYCGKF